MILKPVGVELVVVRRFPAAGTIDRRIDRSILDRARVSRDGRACTDVCNAQIQKKKGCRSVGCCAGDIEWIDGRRAGCCERSQSNQRTSQCQRGACVAGKSTCRRPFRLMGVCVPLRAAAAAAQGATCHAQLISKHVALMSAPDTFRRTASVECELSDCFGGAGLVRGEGSGGQQTTPHRRARTHARTRARAHARTQALTR